MKKLIALSALYSAEATQLQPDLVEASSFTEKGSEEAFASFVKPEGVQLEMASPPLDYAEVYADLQERRVRGHLRSPDAFKSLEDIATENGFRVEKHDVVTDDGYILAVWRIPGQLTEDSQEGGEKPPVLLLHGLNADMMEWVFNRPEFAPAFMLARAGYDVWLANNRGNRFSMSHKTLTPKDKAFWQFSWEEMGTHDTPAMIDYILEKTGFSKINCIGHSQGTSQILAGAALMPEYYKEKVNIAFFLAPPAAMNHTGVTILKILALKANRVMAEKVLDFVHMWNLIPYNFMDNSRIASVVCDLFDGKLCSWMLSLISDDDPTVDYKDRYDVYVSNFPAGSGYHNWFHYCQLVNQKEQVFRRFDYESKDGNMQHYEQDTPPDYDLSLLDFPMALFSGSEDLLADPKDVAWMISQLKPESVVFHHEYYMGHMSFAIAKDMSWFEVDLLAILNHYNGRCDPSTASSRFAAGNEQCKESLYLY